MPRLSGRKRSWSKQGRVGNLELVPQELSSAPAGTLNAEFGQVVHANGNIYMAGLTANNLTNWVLLGGAAGDVRTLSDNAGTVVNPAAGNIQLSGAANELVFTSGGAGLMNAAFVPNVIFTQGNVAITRANVAAPVSLVITNTDNTSILSHSEIQLRPGGPLGGDSKATFYNNVGGASTVEYSIGLDNNAGDIFKISNSASLGINDMFSYDPVLALFTFISGDVLVSRTDSGASVDINVSNSGAGVGSDAIMSMATVSAGSDPFNNYSNVTSGDQWSAGMLETSSAYTIANGASLTASPAFRITDTALDVEVVAGNISILGTGKQLRQEGGAATDFIGEVVLVAGTATVANTNIAANDHIFFSRRLIGGTTGGFTYSINPGVDWTITSSSGTDTSTVSYWIVRQL